MHDSTHRAIRKSERAGLTVRVSRSEQDLRTFFEMHLKVRKYKYGLLAQPYSFFQNIWRHFVDVQHGFLLLAIHEDKIVAGDFFLDWKDTLYYKFNASVPGDLPYRPNDLLIWEGVRHAKERGFTYLDFGLSDIDQEGLIRYKRKFGTEEKTISFPTIWCPTQSQRGQERTFIDYLVENVQGQECTAMSVRRSP